MLPRRSTSLSVVRNLHLLSLSRLLHGVFSAKQACKLFFFNPRRRCMKVSVLPGRVLDPDVKERGRERMEKSDHERETRERVRHAPGTLKVNLENQIKAVFWSRDSPKTSVRGVRGEDGSVRGREGDVRARRREERGDEGFPTGRASKTMFNTYAVCKRRICRARAGGGQSFSALFAK